MEKNQSRPLCSGKQSGCCWIFKSKRVSGIPGAVIAHGFNLDEVSQRILNADGASWIKKVKDKSTCFQLDPFHRDKAVKEKIHEEAAQNAILELLREEEIEDTEELIRYYENNREGLLLYQTQCLELPEPPEGLEPPGKNPGEKMQ